MRFSVTSPPSLLAFSLFLEAILAKPFVHLVYAHNSTCLDFKAVPACFGPPISVTGFTGYLVEAVPPNACHPLEASPAANTTQLDFIVLIRRSDCPFGAKVLHAQEAGFRGAIIHNIYSDLLVSMAVEVQEFKHQISIPSLFIGGSAAKTLRKHVRAEKAVQIYTVVPQGYYNPCGTNVEFSPARHYLPFWLGYCTQIMVLRFLQEFGSLLILSVSLTVLTFLGWMKWRRRSRGVRVKRFKSGDRYDVCVICMAEYEPGDQLKILPCHHAYHNTCIDTWLLIQPRVGKTCPICKQKINLEI